VSIQFSCLHTSGPHPNQAPEPLSELKKGNGHIHGGLEILINGRSLPRIPFGRGDICLGEWIGVLGYLMTLARSDDDYTCEFDPTEQGYSKFLFRVEGPGAFVSIVSSPIGGGQADPEWQDVRCDRTDLAEAILEFLSRLKGAIVRDAGEAGRDWWKSCNGDFYVA